MSMSEARRRALGAKLAEACAEYELLETEAKASAKDYRERLAIVKRRRSELAEELRTGRPPPGQGNLFPDDDREDLQ